MKAQLVDRLQEVRCDREPFSPEHAKCICRLTSEAADEIERLTKMVRHASECGVTFPPDTLPRVPGEVIVSCPVCKTDWKFNDHDNCPTCALAPQGIN